MHYALHVWLFSVAFCGALSSGKPAKSAINPDILTTFAKNVASVLSPTLLGDLQNNRANKSRYGLSTGVKKYPEEDTKDLPVTRDSEKEAATPEIYRDQGVPYRLEDFSNTRRQADDLYNPYERANYPENPGYRQSQYFDPYNVPNNYFQGVGPDNRNALRGNLNLDRPVNSGNLANTENAGSPGRFGQLSRPNDRVLNEGPLGRQFGGFNGFAGYSSFDDRRRGDLRYHHSPLPIDGHYFGPFGFDPHVPYHPLGYKYPYDYHDRRPNTDSNNNNDNNNNNSGANNASKEETKEEDESDRPKSDRRHYYGGYKPFYGFPGYPGYPPYKFGPGYHHRGGYNDSYVDHRHYDDPYYHKHYDFPYYDDFYFPGPFHPYGYGPRPKNGNKNGGNGNGDTPAETPENKDAETISASEKTEEAVGSSSSEYQRRVPAVPFEDGLDNERIVDQEIIDSVEGVDPNEQ